MRFALGLEYDGSALHGWQIQVGQPHQTAQGLLESALSKVADAPIRVSVAGRTDAGVHACEQVVHFDSPCAREDKAWIRGGNSMLPTSMRILWARQVGTDFHARFSARARRYCYMICTRETPAPLLHNRCYQTDQLSVTGMRRAATFLVGQHDFSSFRAAACQAKTPCRHVHFARVHAVNDWIFVDIQANGFLQHMVRNIVGSLLEVGRGNQPPEWIGELLEARQRARAAPTAPASALYLSKVRYAPSWQLPNHSILRAMAPWAHHRSDAVFVYNTTFNTTVTPN